MKTNATWAAVVCFGGALLLAQQVQADIAGRQGKPYTLACGGNYSATQASNWTFRNYNETVPVKIVRMRFFDAQGTLIHDSLVSGLPAASNGLLGAANNTLEAHQSALFTSDTLIADGTLAPLPSTQRPIMLIVNAAGHPVAQPLAGTLTRITRSADTGAETGRTASDCSIVSPVRNGAHD